jgi:hypothetical protein
MGAMNFSAIEIGRTAQEAFRSAQERAQWEYGHDPYSGTIGAKHDFLEIKVPEGMNPQKFLAALTAWECQKNLYDPKDRGWVHYTDAKGKERKTRYVGGKYRETKWVPDHGGRANTWKAIDGVKHVRATTVKMLKGFAPPREAFWDDKQNPAACIDLGPATKANLEKLGLLNEWEFKPQRGKRIFKFWGSARS